MRLYCEATHSQGLCHLHLLPKDRVVGGRCSCGLYEHLDGTYGFPVAEGEWVSIVAVVNLSGRILV